MRIRIGERYELRKVDERNWQLFEWSRIETRVDNKPTGQFREEWKGLSCYFGNVADAGPMVLDRYMAGMNATVTAREFAEQMQAAAHELAQAVKAVER